MPFPEDADPPTGGWDCTGEVRRCIGQLNASVQNALGCDMAGCLAERVIKKNGKIGGVSAHQSGRCC